MEELIGRCEKCGKVRSLESFESELRRYFGEDCTSVRLAGERYKSALNLLSLYDLQFNFFGVVCCQLSRDLRHKIESLMK